MNVYTNTEFRGAWPVGTAAVVVAESAVWAAKTLEKQLSEIGLSQSVNPEDMILVDVRNRRAIILNNGEY